MPVIGHVHGTELLMLEQIEAGAPDGWSHAGAWRERLRRWAGNCERIIVDDKRGLARAARLLGVPRERFAVVPNGFEPAFAPRLTDREAVWRRVLGQVPRGTVFALRRPLHRREAPAVVDRGVRRGAPPQRRADVTGA